MYATRWGGGGNIEIIHVPRNIIEIQHAQGVVFHEKSNGAIDVGPRGSSALVFYPICVTFTMFKDFVFIYIDEKTELLHKISNI